MRNDQRRFQDNKNDRYLAGQTGTFQPVVVAARLASLFVKIAEGNWFISQQNAIITACLENHSGKPLLGHLFLWGYLLLFQILRQSDALCATIYLTCHELTLIWMIKRTHTHKFIHFQELYIFTNLRFNLCDITTTKPVTNCIFFS